MKMKIKKHVVSLVVLLMAAGFAHASIADFENLTLSLESWWSGTYPYVDADSDGTADDSSETITFHSGSAAFNNTSGYSWGYPFWYGFAYSNLTDTTASGWDAQYNAIAGSGADDSENYGIGYVGGMMPPTIAFDTPQVVSGLNVTNTNYAYYSMLYGDGFAKQFGATVEIDSETGEAVIVNMDAEDWFLLTITGKDAQGQITTAPVEFYLADFRFADNTQDYIVNTWEYVDLSSLGVVKTLEFALTSSDNDPVLGMNTPSYFAIDNIIPEPATVALLGLGAALFRRKKS